MEFIISSRENVQDGLTLNQQIDLALPAFSISRQQILKCGWWNTLQPDLRNWETNVWIDLVTVFDAILTSRQTCEKLQCLYENLLSNDFRKTAVLKKNMSCKLKLQNKGLWLKIFWGVPVLKFVQRLALDFSYICL